MSIAENLRGLAFKISIKDRIGSGVIYLHPDDSVDTLYIFTAKHVIYGKNGDEIIDTKDINCEFKYNDLDDFQSITIQTVLKSEDNDLAILIVSKEEALSIIGNLPNYNLITIPFSEKRFVLRGFPSVLENNAVTLTAKFNDKDRSGFKVQLDGELYATKVVKGDAAFIIGGISGAGVFIESNNTLHLVGIVSGFLDNDGVFNIVKCVYIKNINKLLFINHYKECPLFEGIVTYSYNSLLGTEKVKYLDRSVSIVKPKDRESKNTEDKRAEEIRLIDAVIQNKRISVVGVGGIGKTFEIKNLFNSLRAQGYYPTPIINLQNLTKTIIEKIVEREPEWESYPKEKSVVLLDGLDESPNQFDVIAQIEELGKDSSFKIVVTCRVNFYYTNSTINNFITARLYQLSEAEAIEFIKENTKSSTRPIENDKIDQVASSLGCLTNPFFLINFVDLYCNEDISLTNSALEILDRLVDTTSDSNLKRHHPSIRNRLIENKELIELALKRTALVLKLRGLNSMPQKELRKVVQQETIELMKHVHYFVNEDQVYGFDHKNFLNYLAAKALEDSPYESIIKIFFAADKVISVNMIEVFGYWIGLKTENRDKVLGDYNFKNLELLMDLDIEAIAIRGRKELLFAVLERYNSRNVYLKSDQVEKLINLGNASDNISSIAKKLVDSGITAEGIVQQLNALRVLGGLKVVEKEIDYIRDRLIEIILGGNSYVAHSAIYALSNLKLNDKRNISLLIEGLAGSQDQYIKAGIYYAILSSNEVNQFVEFILNEVKSFPKEKESYTTSTIDHEPDLADVKWNLRGALDKIDSCEGLKKVIDFFADNKEKLREFDIIEEKGFFPSQSLIERLASCEVDSELFEAVYKFLKSLIYDHSRSIRVLGKYFIDIGREIEVYKRALVDLSNDYDKRELISSILSKNLISQIVDDLKENRIGEELVDLLVNSFFSPSDDIHSLLLSKVLEVNPNFRKIPNEAEQKRTRDDYDSKKIDLILQKGDVLSYIEDEVFKDDLQDITFDAFYAILKDDFSSPREPIKDLALEIFQTLRSGNLRRGKDIVYRKDVIDYFSQANFNDYQVGKIYEVIDNNRFELDSKVVDFIDVWCRSAEQYFLEEVDFNSIYSERKAGLLWFFHKRLGIQVVKEVLLKFLHFDLNRYNGERIQKQHEYFFEFDKPVSDSFLSLLEKDVPRNEIEAQIASNAYNGLPTIVSFRRHLLYIQIYELSSCINFLVDFITSNNEYDFFDQNLKYKAVEILLLIGKERLEQAFDNIINDNYKYSAAKLLLNYKSEVARSYFLRRLENGAEEDRFIASKHLFHYTDEVGLEYFTNRIESTLKFIEGFESYEYHNGEYFSLLSSPSAFPYLFRMLRASSHDDFVNGQSNNSLQYLAKGTLMRLASDTNEYSAVINGFKDFRTEFPQSQFNDIDFFIERLEVDEAQLKAKLTLEEAIAIADQVLV